MWGLWPCLFHTQHYLLHNRKTLKPSLAVWIITAFPQLHPSLFYLYDFCHPGGAPVFFVIYFILLIFFFFWVIFICLQCGRPGFDPWVRKIPWRQKWQPTPVLVPGKSHGPRSLVGYSPWGYKDLDTSEWLHLFLKSLTWMKVKVTQSCPTLCNPMDYTVPGILQARIQERVADPFSRGSSQPRDRTQVSHIAGRFFTSWATREESYYHQI